MEIGEYLEELKTILEEMNEKDLRTWVYNYARKLPEKQRSQLLEALLEKDEDVN